MAEQLQCLIMTYSVNCAGKPLGSNGGSHLVGGERFMRGVLQGLFSIFINNLIDNTE